MPEPEISEEEARNVRKRVKYEDQLLNSRTGIVLTFNGLMAVAASFKLPGLARSSLVVVVIVINLLWFFCALDAYRCITELTKLLKDSPFASIDEKIRQDFQRDKLRIGTTRFMAIILPGLLVAGWLVVSWLAWLAK